MRKPIKTGKAIYEEIKRIEDELGEIVDGMDAVDDVMDRDSVPYQLLQRQHDEKEKELQNLFSNKYTYNDPSFIARTTDLDNLGEY